MDSISSLFPFIHLSSFCLSLGGTHSVKSLSFLVALLFEVKGTGFHDPMVREAELGDYLYFHYPDDLDGKKETHAAKLADSFHKLPPHRNPWFVLWFII